MNTVEPVSNLTHAQYHDHFAELEKRLGALETLVLKQHEIIGILIKIGKEKEKNE